MAKNEPDEKKNAPTESAATAAAKQLHPEETKPVKSPAPDLSGLRLGDFVWVQLGVGRHLRKPGGGFYDPLQMYYLEVTTTLLCRLKHGDWVIYVQQPNG
jgi:hypothetical protein